MNSRVHLYNRKHINTDEIIPARYLNVHDEEILAQHAMEDIDPGFVGRVESGDAIVGGEDFGCGSSREHAVWALRGAGITTVIADSVSRIFYRNSVNNGFATIEIPGISAKISDGDQISVQLAEGKVINQTKGDVYYFKPFTEYMKTLMDAGGLLNFISNLDTRQRFFG